MRLVFLSLALMLLAALPLWAGDGGNDAPRKIAQAVKEPNKTVKPAPKAAAIEANETDVLEFVREHHPELADLLEQLKET